jgi:hypothetical protein
MDLDTLPTVAPPWHCQPIGTIKIGGLWCHWRAVCLRLTTKILVKWVRFADVTLVICMHLVVMSCATHLQHSLVSALTNICIWWSFPPIFALINSWYGLMGGSVKWLIVCGVMVPWEIMLCSRVFQLAELQCSDGLDNLPFLCCQHPHCMILSFVMAPSGFYSKAYSKGLKWGIKISEQWMHWV